MMLSHSSLSHSKSDNAVHQSVRNASFLSQFVVMMIMLMTTSTSSPTVVSSSSSSSSSSVPFTHPLPSLFNTTSSVHSFVRGFQYVIRDVVAPVPSIVGITDNNSFAFVKNHEEDTAFDIIVVDMEAPLVFYTPPTATAPSASLDDAPFLERLGVGLIVDGVRLCRTVHERTREGLVGLRSVLSRVHRFFQYRLRVVRHNVRVLRYTFRLLCQFLYRVLLFSCLTVVMGFLVILSVNLYFEMKFWSAGWCGAFLLLCFVYNWFCFGYVRTFIVFMSLVFVTTSRGCFNPDRCLVLVLALALVSSNIVSIVLRL